MRHSAVIAGGSRVEPLASLTPGNRGLFLRRKRPHPPVSHLRQQASRTRHLCSRCKESRRRCRLRSKSPRSPQGRARAEVRDSRKQPVRQECNESTPCSGHKLVGESASLVRIVELTRESTQPCSDVARKQVRREASDEAEKTVVLRKGSLESQAHGHMIHQKQLPNIRPEGRLGHPLHSNDQSPCLEV